MSLHVKPLRFPVDTKLCPFSPYEIAGYAKFSGCVLSACALAQFELRFRNTYKTNGGFMFDAAVTFEDRETVHRVIVGREYYEDFGMEAQEVVAMAFRFLLARRVPRQTEGAPDLASSTQAPVCAACDSPCGHGCHRVSASCAACPARPRVRPIWNCSYSCFQAKKSQG